jgi:hypothetical protein
LCRQLHGVIGYCGCGEWRGWTRAGKDLPQRHGGAELRGLSYSYSYSYSYSRSC